MAVSTRKRVIREAKRSALRSVRLSAVRLSAHRRSVRLSAHAEVLTPKSALRYRGRGITIDVAGVLVPVLNYQ